MKGVENMEIKEVCVVGAGIMGNGISQVASSAGYKVVLIDVDDAMLERGLERIRKSLGRLKKAGKLDDIQAEEILSRIKGSVNLQEGAKNSDVIIEAVTENIDIKHDIFKKLDQICKPETIFASNTSQYSISRLSAVTNRKDKVIGMHWFNPPVMMKLIELVKGLDTTDKTLQIIEEFSHNMGKETVVASDSPGFITSRAIAAFMRECQRIYEEGVASIEDIDKACKLAFNHPMGPFELADFTGIDTGYYVAKSLEDSFGERFKPSVVVNNMVNVGYHGRKSGRGWYHYEGKE